MKPENHTTPAGHARLHSAHHRTSAIAESPVRGHRDKPSPPFDAHDRSNDADGFSHILRSMPLTLGITIAAYLLLITLGAAIALRSPDPVALTVPFAYGAVGIASFLGGILSARRNPAAPLAGGLMTGLALSMILVLIGLCTGRAPISVWIVRLFVIPIHLLGAYIARPRDRVTNRAHHTTGEYHRT